MARPADPRERGLLTVAGAAYWLHVSRNTLYKLIYSGEIPTIELKTSGKTTVRRIRVADLDAWSKRHAGFYRPGATPVPAYPEATQERLLTTLEEERSWRGLRGRRGRSDRST